MNFIGSIPKPIWNIAQAIAREEAYPVEQPENCPYIILTHITEKQILSLEGILKRQHMNLFLTNIFPPGEIKNSVHPGYPIIHKANTDIWTLISKALTRFLQTSSIDKQV